MKQAQANQTEHMRAGQEAPRIPIYHYMSHFCTCAPVTCARVLKIKHPSHATHQQKRGQLDGRIVSTTAPCCSFEMLTVYTRILPHTSQFISLKAVQLRSQNGFSEKQWKNDLIFCEIGALKFTNPCANPLVKQLKPAHFCSAWRESITAFHGLLFLHAERGGELECPYCLECSAKPTSHHC